MALYITGDTHGELSRFSLANLPCDQWTMNDYLLISGDFGYIFYQDIRDQQKLNYLENMNFQILFIDGNHEAFPAINKYPVEEWHGGKVHRIRHNIRHLMRGQIFEIEGLSVFTMGGAYSIDKWRRHEGCSWWPEEMPTEADYQEAWNNLSRYNNKVDLIVTHAAPEETMQLFYQMRLISDIAPDEAALNNFLQAVQEKISYRHWYFGHMHVDRELWRNQTALFYDIYNAKTHEKIK